MQNILKSLVVGLLLLTLSGCSYDALTKKEFAHPDENIALIKPNPKLLTIVLIRPNSFAYFGYPIEVFMNDTSQVSLPNQSFSIVTMPLDSVLIRGQSNSRILGPPTKTTRVESQLGEVLYLEWKTSTEAYINPAVPVYRLSWEILSKDDADVLLKEVQYVSPKINVQNQ